MDLSDMPVDNKQQQTMMWQQNQYMADSGIHSGATTQASDLYVLWFTLYQIFDLKILLNFHGISYE